MNLLITENIIDRIVIPEKDNRLVMHLLCLIYESKGE